MPIERIFVNGVLIDTIETDDDGQLVPVASPSETEARIAELEATVQTLVALLEA